MADGGVSKKLGGGGHEQEAYDTATGKYVSEGQTSENSEQKLSNSLVSNQGNVNLKSSLANRIKNMRLEKERESKKLYNIGWLRNSDEIVDNLDKFFSDDIIDDLIKNISVNRNGDKYFSWVKDATLPSGKTFSNNIFISLFASTRYKSNAVEFIDENEFEQMKERILTEGTGYGYDRMYDYDVRKRNFPSNHVGCGLALTWRGVNASSMEDLNYIVNSCADKNNNVKYSAQSGQCHGTTFYTAMSRDYALLYAGYRGNYRHVLENIVDLREKYILPDDDIEKIQYDLLNNKRGFILKKVHDMVYARTKDEENSKLITDNFEKSLMYDTGLTSILLGVDALTYTHGNGNQMDVYNLGIIKSKRKKVTGDNLG